MNRTATILTTLGIQFTAMVVIVATHQKGDGTFKQNLRVVPPPNGIERFSFGYRDSMADGAWLRVIQDIDICEKVPGGHVKRTAEHTPEAACTRGWVYQMFNAITNLSPKWKLPYRIAGSVLSIMVDDREGASLILEKGMREFPTDYNIHYVAAYHYIYEMNNPKRAAEALLVSAKQGGPYWFYSLAAKLMTEAGQTDLARGVLQRELEEFKDDEVAKERIQWRLDQINEKAKSVESEPKSALKK